MDSNSHSFSDTDPDKGKRVASSWTLIRSPIPSAGNSPNSDFCSNDREDFSDPEVSTALHPTESPVMSMDDLNTSTALIHGLGGIELADHGESKLSHDIPVIHRGREGVALKIEQYEQWEFLGDSDIGVWSGGGGAKYTSIKPGVKPESVEKICLLDTDCFSPGPLISPEIPSGFSDHSTINSTTLHSSSSSLSPKTNRQERMWALAASTQRQQDSAQSSNPRRLRAFSLSKTDSAEFSTRKWAASDSTRLPPTDINLSAGLDTSDCFLSIPKRGTHGQAYTSDSQHQTRPRTAPSSTGTSIPADAVPSTENHQNPAFVTYQAPLHSPTGDARARQAVSSSLTPHVNTGFKAQVASEAVIEAAKKKRRKRDGAGVFECPMCSHQLTTKQNLQYHIAAHSGKRDHLCGRCGKAFTTPHTRTRHETRCRNLFNPAGGPIG